MFPDDLIKRITEAGVIAVLTIVDPADAVPVALALAEGGVTAIEMTLRTARAPESIRRIRTELPEILIGAGTVLNRGQVKIVQEAGALFAVSPGCNPSTLQAARDAGLPFAPGIATPSDIEIAVGEGCRLLKYFPAENSGGLGGLTVMNAPFAHLGLRYIPLGGIALAQLGDYLKSPLVAAVGGSWLARADVIQSRDWPEVTRHAAAAMNVVRSVRAG